MSRSFLKMHGLGNDFVVLDARSAPLALSAEAARRIADRRTGVGCDQLVVIEPAPDAARSDAGPAAGPIDARLRLFNADGGEVGACGNATRCVARLVMDETGRDTASFLTAAGRLDCRGEPDGSVTADMGPARLDWAEIPVRAACDTLHMPVGAGALADPVGVSMGNPHAVFFVDDVEAMPLAELGPVLEHDPFFPERANIGVARRLGPDRLRLRVWERGAGITRACGTGACAAAVAAARRGLTGRAVTVELDGGALTIRWRESDGHVLMTGPTALSFIGTLDRAFLDPSPTVEGAAGAGTGESHGRPVAGLV
ncbi:MAG: diaminopimelate epimerase [Azospirillaceae bacterium]